MNIFKRMFSGETEAESNALLVVPRSEPGWNVSAESYFRKELKPLAGTEITVILQTVDEQDGGWDETNLLYKGGKVGQLPNTYHQRLGSVLRDLRSKGKQLECIAYVSKELELTLLAPYPENLIPFIRGTHPIDLSRLQSRERKSIRVKETGKHQPQLRAIWQTMDSADWSGSVKCQKYIHSGGKYDGQEGIEVLAADVKIGSISPRYVEDLSPVLESLESGVTEFECRIALSQFEEGKLYATLFT